MSSIFLSHSHSDKPFARRIARDLKELGVRVWIDDAEIKIGDSLIEKIRAGIDQMEYVGVILSAKSVSSEWVKKEVDIAMNQEIEGQRVKVLPLLVDDCELPGFLKGKLYADFRKPDSYQEEFTKLSNRLGVTASIKQSKRVTSVPSSSKKKTTNLTKTPQTDLVDKLLNARTERENKEKAEKLEAEKKLNEKEEYRKQIIHQFESAFLRPIKDFIREFNSKYEGEGLRTHGQSKGSGFVITLSQNKKIEVEIRPIFDDDFYREREIDDYGHRTKVTQLELPMYENRKIMAWGNSRGSDERGFNMILVEDERDSLGEWYILKNTNRITVTNPRLPEPFPFDFRELEKEIKLIKSYHIYKTEVRPFKIDYLIELIEAYI